MPTTGVLNEISWEDKIAARQAHQEKNRSSREGVGGKMLLQLDGRALPDTCRANHVISLEKKKTTIECMQVGDEIKLEETRLID